ncbi:bifunctional folylpolyglutamate synthase/dihydrofolate synthase [Hippea sp. KM1]|uniref:bifunctional folylpolyglutamate synthase/dihydrofolate synthase n=1 Tax=Hippea sp. KM1 TaxID=944481 RepID=UPI00046D9319|nr:Mur ligase family protein [Hippea sp. KM1]
MNEIEAFLELNRILNSLNPYAMDLSLDRIKSFLNKIGNPQDSFKSILVGGTNGKGSVVSMLSLAFEQADYNVGTYTSPHLIQLNERFRINGKVVPFYVLLDYARFIQSINFERLTYFEFLTVMAFLLFKDFGVDVAVLEVGMGGEFDATNVVNPILSIITSISFDHTQHLGDTLEKITLTKSKIIKNLGVVCKNPDVVIKTIKDSVDAEVFFVDDSYVKRAEGLGFFNVSLDNVAVALLAIDILNQRYGFGLDPFSIKRVFWPGRFEVIESKGRLFILDGAHNASAVENLIGLIKRFGFCVDALVFATLKTKDWQGNLAKLCTVSDNIKIPRLKSSLAVEPHQIESFLLKNRGCTVEVFNSVNACINSLLDSDYKTILLCGSLYLVGEALACSLIEEGEGGFMP